MTATPTPFGNYYLLERINVGGMAEVFRAKTFGIEGFERFVAVKRILNNIAADKEFVEMFVDEAKIAVQLSHANVAQIFELGKVDGSYFIAMEYVHGKDLRSIFDSCRAAPWRAMPIAQACFIVMKVCEGLDYAHNKRDTAGQEMHLVHRDVSPQNILVSYEGEVKLIDFGIAKAIGKGANTQAGILKGKFGYMSPEQVRGLSLDRRSDIFSAGILLYEIATGQRLFLGDSDLQTLEKVRNVEALPPATYNPKVTRDLEQIIFKALARDVDERYQNAIDLHDDLQAYLYRSGQSYSRNDLAAWMKQHFAEEISEEAAKLEAYRRLAPLDDRQRRGSSRAPNELTIDETDIDAQLIGATEATPEPGYVPIAVASDFARVTPSNVAKVETAQATWEPEDLETQIFDRPPGPSAGPIVSTDAASKLGDTPLPEATETLSRPAIRLSKRARPYRTAVFLLAALVLCALAGLFFSLRARAPHAKVELVAGAVPITGVDLMIDGQVQSNRSLPLTLGNLGAGSHEISVRKNGYLPWRQSFALSATQRIRQVVTLEPIRSGELELRSRPVGAFVYLDHRKLQGHTNMRITGLQHSRAYLLEVRKPGFLTWSKEVQLKDGERLKLEVEMMPSAVEVSIKSAPVAEAGAYLVQAGKEQFLGNTPLSLRLNPRGKYVVVVRRTGFVEWKSPVVFGGSGPMEVVAQLKPTRGSAPTASGSAKPAGGPAQSKPGTVATEGTSGAGKAEQKPGTGSLAINSRPWTEIEIDGKGTGLTTPQNRIEVEAGEHRVRLKNEKFKISEEVNVTVVAGKLTKVVKEFKTE